MFRECELTQQNIFCMSGCELTPQVYVISEKIMHVLKQCKVIAKYYQIAQLMHVSSAHQAAKIKILLSLEIILSWDYVDFIPRISVKLDYFCLFWHNFS